MQKKVFFKYFIFFFFLFNFAKYSFCDFQFDSRFSTFKINSGAIFHSTNQISGYDGTLIKENGGTITGSDIEFENGILEDEGNNILLTGLFSPSGTITLSGDDRFRAEPGSILQSLFVNGDNNLLEGQPFFSSDIILQDSSTTLTIGIQSTLNNNIVLNNGELTLIDDLYFNADKIITDNGTVKGNKYKISTGSEPLTWDSQITWENSNIDINAHYIDFSGTFTFNGSSSIDGKGNILDLESGGTITVASGSVLYLSDLVLKGVGAGGGSFQFESDNAEIRMSNVQVELVGDFSTTNGGIYIDGGSTWIIKDHNWTIDTLASLTVDGVTLWLDNAGEPVIGDLNFGTPESSYLTLVSSGTIKTVISEEMVTTTTNELQQQIDALETSTGYLQEQININITDIDNLETSTGYLQEQIDELATNTCDCELLQEQIDALETSTGELQDLININITDITNLQTSTGYLQSLIDINIIDIDNLETSTGYLQEQIDELATNTCDCELLQEQIDALETSTGELQDLININITDITNLQTSTGELQNLIDINIIDIDNLETSTGYLQSLIDINIIDIDNLETSTGYLQNQININITDIDNLETSTGYLQEQIDALETSTGELQDLININITDITNLQTSTGYLQSLIDINIIDIDNLETSTGYLQEQININITDIDNLETSTGYLQEQIDELATNTCDCKLLQEQIDALETSTGELQNLIDINITDITNLQTSTGYLQSLIDINIIDIDNLETSTGYLQEQIDELATNTCDCEEIYSLIDALETSTGELQNQINTNITDITNLETSTGELQNLIDINIIDIDNLETSTGYLQEQIDELATNTCDCEFLQQQIDTLGTSTDYLQSLVNINITDITNLQTSTGYLQSLVDINIIDIDNLETSTGYLQSLIDINITDIDNLETSTGYLQVQIDELATNTCDCELLQEQIDALETSTGELQDLININITDIDNLETSTGYLQEQIDELATNTCDCELLQEQIDTLGTSTDYLQSLVDINITDITNLQTSTGYLQSLIDINIIDIDNLETSTGYLQEQIDAIASHTCDCEEIYSLIDALETSTGELQDLININITDITNLQTSTGYLQSLININITDINNLETSTEYLQNLIDINIIDIDNLETSTGYLQEQIDSIASHTCDCEEIYSLIDALETSTSDLQNLINLNIIDIDNLETSTGYLQEQIDAIASHTCDCEEIYSLIDALETSTGELQSLIDINIIDIDNLETSTGYLQEQIDSIASHTCDCEEIYSLIDALETSTGDLQNLININITDINNLETSTGYLQNLIDINIIDIDNLETSTGYLQEQIDSIASHTCDCEEIYSLIDALETSTGDLQNLINLNIIDIDNLETSTGYLQEQIDAIASHTCDCEEIYSLIDALETSTGDLQNQININITDIDNLETSTGSLQEQIDELATNTCNCEFLQQQIDTLGTSTDYLQSLVDINITDITNLQTSTGYLQSLIDINIIDIDNLETSTGYLQVQIDELATNTCDCELLQQQINNLETSTGYLQEQIDAIVTNTCSCEYILTLIEELQTSTGYLQEQIDALKTSTCCDIIQIDGTVNFIPSMLPISGKTKVFRFNSCCDPCGIPTLIFNPLIYGSGGHVDIPEESTIVFEGKGFIQLMDGVQFNLHGGFTETDCELTYTTCSQIIVKDRAIMTVDKDSEATIAGIGNFTISGDGALILDQENSQFIFGKTTNDILQVLIEDQSLIGTYNETAVVTFGLATFNVDFVNSSMLEISKGLVEFNTNHYVPAAGKLKTLRFFSGSMLFIDKIIENGVVIAGTLSLHPNIDNSPIKFDNTNGLIKGKGHVHYSSADLSITTTLLIQENYFESSCTEGDMVDLFINLTKIENNAIVCENTEAAILAQLGSTNPALDGRLVVFDPALDGSIFLLEEGDHDVLYVTSGNIIIIGIDKNGNIFSIDKSGNRSIISV